MTTLTFNALGSTWTFHIFDEITSEPSLKRAIKRLLNEFEANYSRFLPDSLTTRLNRERMINAPPKEFLTLLLLGVKLYEETSGVFNFLVGNILTTRGYGKEFSPSTLQLSSEPPNPNTDIVITNKKVILSGAGGVDFGGYGKGFLIDKIARKFREDFHYSHFIINSGGDIYVESGDFEELSLEHPKDPTQSIGTVLVRNQALCISSPFKKQWKEESTDKIVSHIVSTMPETSYASYVIAHSATVADAYSTALSAINGEYHRLNPATLDTLAFMISDTKNQFSSPNFPLKVETAAFDAVKIS